MLLTTGHARLPLADDEVARLDDALDSRLQVDEGFVWVTVDGERGDWVLTPGESWVVDTARPLVVSALRGPATLSVCVPSGAAGSAGRTRAMRGRWRDWLTSISLSSAAVS